MNHENVPTIQLTDIRPYRFLLNRIRTGKSWSFPRHRHNRVMEFYYLFEGHLTQFMDYGEVTLKEGDIFYVGEEEYHSIKGRNFAFYNLIIPQEDWLEFLKGNEVGRAYENLKTDGLFHRNIALPLRPSYLDNLDKLFHYQKSSYGDLLLSRFLITLLTDLSAPQETCREKALPWWMESLLEESYLKLDEGITTAQMARFCSRSPEHLARSFKRYLGTTPSSWLNDRKLERACLQLEHSNTPVLDIALSLGYDNLNYFYKLFSARYNTPPGEYRKNHTRIHHG